MNLPIDVSHAPYKEKYLLEETPMFRHWMIFGGTSFGMVDINDGVDDIIINIDRTHAEQIIKAREAFLKTVTNILSK